MKKTVTKGSLVDIRVIILKKGERAEQVPEDTSAVDLVMKVKGILEEDAQIGTECLITSPIGRKIKGILIEENPAYTHNFGPPVPELLPIGGELRKILDARSAK